MRGTLRITWPLLSLSIISGVLSNTTMQQDSTATTVTNTVTVSHILSTVQASTAQSIETPESKATTKIPLVDPATVHKEGSTEQSATTTTPSTTVAIVPTPQSTPSVAVLTASTSPSVGLYNPVTTVSSTTPEVKTTAKVVNQPTVPQSTATTVPDSIVQTTTVKTSGASGVSTEKPGQLGTKETPTTSVAGLSAGSDTQTTPLTRMDDRNIGTTKSATTKISVTPSGTSTPKATTGRPSTSSLPPPAAKSSEAPTTFRPNEAIVSMAIGEKTIKYSLGDPKTKENQIVEDLCEKFMSLLKGGNCSVTLQDGKVQFDSLEITGYVKERLVMEEHEKMTKEPATTETDRGTLIAILASCGALLIMIITLGVCVSHRRKPYNETQQHLTEELHTVENGYHDNPTLEVMEVQPEMQEKKVNLNGEFGDSWIVPIDNLIKEDNPDEEDTHL